MAFLHFIPEKIVISSNPIKIWEIFHGIISGDIYFSMDINGECRMSLETA